MGGEGGDSRGPLLRTDSFLFSPPRRASPSHLVLIYTHLGPAPGLALSVSRHFGIYKYRYRGAPRRYNTAGLRSPHGDRAAICPLPLSRARALALAPRSSLYVVLCQGSFCESVRMQRAAHSRCVSRWVSDTYLHGRGTTVSVRLTRSTTAAAAAASTFAATYTHIATVVRVARTKFIPPNDFITLHTERLMRNYYLSRNSGDDATRRWYGASNKWGTRQREQL